MCYSSASPRSRDAGDVLDRAVLADAPVCCIHHLLPWALPLGLLRYCEINAFLFIGKSSSSPPSPHTHTHTHICSPETHLCPPSWYLAVCCCSSFMFTSCSLGLGGLQELGVAGAQQFYSQVCLERCCHLYLYPSSQLQAAVRRRSSWSYRDTLPMSLS